MLICGVEIVSDVEIVVCQNKNLVTSVLIYHEIQKFFRS